MYTKRVEIHGIALFMRTIEISYRTFYKTMDA